ncbi:MAG: Holliday junction branch migration protein RuvA [Lachnospiraceae bacterium]|nr:Holliday junction branch migration protein RuvA [Lachnospiraceae bacterium]
MITYLRGEVAAVYEGRVVLDVNGVGYQIFVSARDAADMPRTGEEVKIHTYMSVSEDAMRLYGFLSEDDLNVYKTMITVSGVGPKAALGILGTLSANDIRFAVFSDDFKAISRAPGVGPKTAKKLILELKDKLKLEDALGNLQQEDIPAAGPAAAAAADAEINDAVQALVALGYSSSEALRAVRKVKITEEMQTQDILKQALKYIGI